MDEAKRQLKQIGRGCVATLWGVMVWRVGDRYIIGRDSVNVGSSGLDLENAAYTLWLLK